MDIHHVCAPVVVARLNGGVSGLRIGKTFCTAQKNVVVTKVMAIFQIQKSELHDPRQ
jgi:hypothetical protein